MENLGRILVVEDRSDWRKKLTGILKEEGYSVREAANYDKAVSLLQKHVFDLVLLDLRLVDWNERDFKGMDLLNDLDKLADEQGTNVIIITGYGTAEHARKAFKDHHVFDFLTKAKFDLQEFKTLVAEAIENAYAKRGDILDEKW